MILADLLARTCSGVQYAPSLVNCAIAYMKNFVELPYTEAYKGVKSMHHIIKLLHSLCCIFSAAILFGFFFQFVPFVRYFLY